MRESLRGVSVKSLSEGVSVRESLRGSLCEGVSVKKSCE